MNELQSIIEEAWEKRAELNPGTASAKIGGAVGEVVTALDNGKLRVAEKIDGEWVVHQWLKKAVLLSFRLEDNVAMSGASTQYYDKVPSKFAHYSREDFARGGFRVVPPAMVRRGAYIAKNAVLMPSYVNIGAYVDEATMVDTWATVGSCAQIGKNVHLSGGVGIGGVLEPIQANPVIIEDNCFIGARSEVVEGVIVEENSVLSMGVYLGQSTKIFDRETGEVLYGRVPAGSVVVSGTLPSGDRSCALYCAVIVKKVDAKTRAKTSLTNCSGAIKLASQHRTTRERSKERNVKGDGNVRNEKAVPDHGRQEGVGHLHFRRRSDQHQDQRPGGAGQPVGDDRRHGPAAPLRGAQRAPDQGIRGGDGAEHRLRDRGRWRLPDQRVPPEGLPRRGGAFHPRQHSAARYPRAARGAEGRHHAE